MALGSREDQLPSRTLTRGLVANTTEQHEGVLSMGGAQLTAPLLAKPDNRFPRLFPFSLTANVYNKSGNLLFAQS